MAETVYGVLDRIEKRQQEIEIAPNGLSIDLLRAIYRSSTLPLHTRMRAAMACLKHEVPALLATAIVNEGSFAEILERRLQRLKQLEETKLIDAPPTNGNAPLTSGNAIDDNGNVHENGCNPVDARLPPSIPDRRYRRF